MKIYLASSWCNIYYPEVLQTLRLHRHEVYDFRTANGAFSWNHLDSDWQDWDTSSYVAALSHPIAEKGFQTDFEAMKAADAFVLLNPCGRSAHLELGWAIGQGKPSLIYSPVKQELELMYKLADRVTGNLSSVFAWCDTQARKLIMK